MFGLGLPEVIFIIIVGVIILGPDKMPLVARKLGGWLGKMRSAATSLNDAIAKDAELSELRNDIVNANDTLKHTQHTLGAYKLPSSVSEAFNQAKQAAAEAAQEINAAASDKPANAVKTIDNASDTQASEQAADTQISEQAADAQTNAASDNAKLADQQASASSFQTSSLFAHIESRFNRKSVERVIYVEKAIFVSTPIALATSRFAKPLAEPTPPTCIENTIRLIEPKKGRAFTKIRVLSAGKPGKFQTISLSQAKP